eukprot:360171-Hanusia_phi.AAC.1
MTFLYGMTARVNELQWMLDEFFEVSKRGSTISTEIRAGIPHIPLLPWPDLLPAGTASFLTLSYLLLVNPQ